MLNEKQILQVREHLDNAQNPVFFYDNDADGFCSYVLLRRFTGRGKGVSVRSHPDVDEKYAKKAQELGADYVFVLDRPVLGERFVQEVKSIGLPIVWIDHHSSEEDLHYDGLFRFNPLEGKVKSDEPVSYWAYRISGKKEDVWLGIMGCIADHHLPDFAEEFKENWSELWGENIKKPFDAYYKSEIGKLARVVGFGLKDSVTHVVQMQNSFIKCKSPADLLSEMESNKPFVKKYKDLMKKYSSLLTKAERNVKGKLLFFNYGGDMSISSEISNELSYKYPEKVVLVAYSSGPITNISIRGKSARKILESTIKNFENASGGGHESAVGARIQSKDLERFKEEVEKRL